MGMRFVLELLPVVRLTVLADSSTPIPAVRSAVARARANWSDLEELINLVWD